MNSTPEKTDGALLGIYAATGDQKAFTELVQRHGAMVHGIAWRVLGDHHEAQDVAQAVFVTLARKAHALRKDQSISGWLHHVAVCMARDVRLSRSRRQHREEKAMDEARNADAPPVDHLAFQAELDAAIDQLPERYRRPLVLFHLQSKSLDETGRLLGLKPNTLRTRLGRARELLRQKLVRRGITIGSVSALTALLSAESGAAVLPSTFVTSTVGAATGIAAVSASVSALSQGALKAMFVAKVQTVSLTVAACLVLAGTGIVVAKQLTAPHDLATTGQNASTLPPAQSVLPNENPPVPTAVATSEPQQVTLPEPPPPPTSNRFTRGKIVEIEPSTPPWEGVTVPAKYSGAADLLKRWLAAVWAGDLEAHRQCLHSGARQVNEYGTAEALAFWGKQIQDLTKEGFRGQWEFHKPAEVNARFPAGSLQAHPVINGNARQEFILLMQENDQWVIVRLFS